MENAGRTIARMWKRVSGYECSVRKRGNEWMLVLEQDGRLITETPVESPGEAIRRAEKLLHEVDRVQ